MSPRIKSCEEGKIADYMLFKSFFILREIYLSPEIYPLKLKKNVGCSQHFLYTSLLELERLGMIKKAGNWRTKYVLTSKGQKVYDLIVPLLDSRV